jgi:hypothetical protein
MNLKRIRLVGVCLVLALAVIGCAGPAPAPIQLGPSAPNAPQAPSSAGVSPDYTPGPDDPHIFFLEPLDGDSVPTSLGVRFGVSRLDLEGKRVYLTIDQACTAVGESLTVDEQHLAYEQDRSSLAVELSVGPHRLCLQVTDNKGVVLDGPGMLQVIDITAE